MKKNFYYPSADSRTKIHAVEWTPESEKEKQSQSEGQTKAVLQICHGMVEYIDRYDEFASFLAERGYVVVGHDHLGHGESVAGETEYGYFHETRGNECVIEDIRALRRQTEEKYPGIPYFMLGHSMGSFLVRQYIQTEGNGLAGAIIMGTGYQSGALLALGRAVCRVAAAFGGWHCRSGLVNAMAFGGFNRRFHPARTPMDWLTKDEKIVDAYLANPWCTFTFTVNAYDQMFRGMQQLVRKDSLRELPKELPLFLTAGAQDPVGGFGKDVEKVFRKYKDCGCTDVRLKLYEGDRHEILNETDRQNVYQDLYEWLEEKRR